MHFNDISNLRKKKKTSTTQKIAFVKQALNSHENLEPVVELVAHFVIICNVKISNDLVLRRERKLHKFLLFLKPNLKISALNLTPPKTAFVWNALLVFPP